MDPDWESACSSRSGSDPRQIHREAGANAKAPRRYGATPQTEAAQGGYAAIIEELLKAGADVNAKQTYKRQRHQAVKALLDLSDLP